MTTTTIILVVVIVAVVGLGAYYFMKRKKGKGPAVPPEAPTPPPIEPSAEQIKIKVIFVEQFSRKAPIQKLGETFYCFEVSWFNLNKKTVENSFGQLTLKSGII